MFGLLAALVVGLLLVGGPAHVAGLIVPVVVDAVDRHAWMRPPAHVIEKCLVTVSPALTYGDSSAAVISKLVLSRILASLNHAAPTNIFSTWRIVSDVAMFPEANHAVFLKTTATVASSGSQAGCVYHFFIAAITSAQEGHCSALTVPIGSNIEREPLQDGPPPEAFSDQSRRDSGFASHRTSPLSAWLEPLRRCPSRRLVVLQR